MARHTSPIPIVLAALLLSCIALGQRIVISPQAIVVNPLPTFAVEVWVDRAPDGRSVPSYAVGEAIRIGVRVSEDAYVYLFSVSAAGEVVQILPNRFDDAGRDAFLRAGATRHFPPPNARYTFAVDRPAGLAKVLAVASLQPLDTRTLASFGSERDFMARSRLGEDGFAQALAIVVQPLPQESWVTAIALYRATLQPLPGERVPPPPPTVRPPQPVDPMVVYQRPRLIAYPDATITRLDLRDDRTRVEFVSRASFDDVYQHLHRQLQGAGWERTHFRERRDRIEATYERDRARIEVDLRDRRDRGPPHHDYRLDIRSR